MERLDCNIYQCGIYAYTNDFYPFIPWLRLNGIKYRIEETDLYENGLVIKIYKGETKQQRRLIRYYMDEIFPKIRDRINRREAK